MAIYAVGDLQGYLTPLRQLLDIVRFDQASDQLWLTGDLVNRGPDSLKVLRYIRSLGKTAIAVLGNHELHLLAIAAGVRKEKEEDTLQAILTAPDRDELLFWLRHLPFVHVNKSLKTIMVHAGVYYKWNKKKLVRASRELENIMQSDHYIALLEHMQGETPKRWQKSLTAWERYHFTANVCTRIRFCTHNGTLDFFHKGPPGSQPNELIPWFRHPQRHCNKWRIVFGHWSALGYTRETNVISLDSGCTWGKQLTIARLDSEEEKMWQVNCC